MARILPFVLLALLPLAAGASSVTESELRALGIATPDAFRAEAGQLLHYGPDECPSYAQFTVHAKHLVIDNAEASPYIMPAPGFPAVRGSTSWTHRTFSDVDLRSRPPACGSFLYVYGVTGIIDVACATIVASTDGERQAPMQTEADSVRPNPAPIVDTSQLLRLDSCKSFSICGDFQGTIWEWDIVGQSAEGAFTQRTGMDSDSNGVPTANQSYLAVSSGCLVFEGSASLFAAGATLDGRTRQIHLHEAQGRIFAEAVSATTLSLEGDLRGTISRTRSGILETAIGGVRSYTADADVHTVQAIEPDISSPLGESVTLILTGIVFFGASIFIRRSAWQLRRIARKAYRLADDGQTTKALRLLDKAEHRNSKDPNAAVIRAYIATEGGDLERALDYHERVHTLAVAAANRRTAVNNAIEAVYCAYEAQMPVRMRIWLDRLRALDPLQAAVASIDLDEGPPAGYA